MGLVGRTAGIAIDSGFVNHLYLWVPTRQFTQRWQWCACAIMCNYVQFNMNKLEQLQMATTNDDGTAHRVQARNSNSEVRLYEVVISSQPCGSSSSSATSSSLRHALMLPSLTRPSKLHWPRHKRAHVNWMERRLWTWERRKCPWLKTCSTSIDVAEDIVSNN